MLTYETLHYTEHARALDTKLALTATNTDHDSVDGVLCRMCIGMMHGVTPCKKSVLYQVHTDPTPIVLYKRCLAALAKMVVYADSYKPQTGTVQSHEWDLLLNQEIGDRIAAAVILQFVFENTELRDKHWQGEDDLQRLISRGYSSWTDPGPKVLLPSKLHWSTFSVAETNLNDTWKTVIQTYASKRIASKK